MVEERVTDGRRIGQLLASEVRGHTRGLLGSLAVTDVQDADGRDADGSNAGQFAYGIDRGDERLAAVFVYKSGVSLAVLRENDAAVAAAERNDLAVRENVGHLPGVAVSVESGAAVKRALNVLEAVLEAADGTNGTPDREANGIADREANGAADPDG